MGKNLKENSCFKDSMKYQSIELTLLLSGPKKSLVQNNLSFTKRLFQSKIEDQSGSKYFTFTITTGNAKETGKIEYYLKPPLEEYNQKTSKSFCFSSLASKFIVPGENNYARAIAIQIEESLHF